MLSEFVFDDPNAHEKVKPGMEAIEVVENILKGNKDVTQLTVITHPVGLNWSQDYSTEEERKQNFLCAYEPEFTQSGIHPLKVAEFTKARIIDIQEKARKQCNNNHIVVSLTSEVVLIAGGKMHLAMMNFHPEGDYGTDEIVKALEFRHPGMPAVLLNSGRHQHLYGFELLSQRQWEEWMGTWAIPFYFIHPGYLGYRLSAGYSTLRLTSDAQFKPTVPYVT